MKCYVNGMEIEGSIVEISELLTLQKNNVVRKVESTSGVLPTNDGKDNNVSFMSRWSKKEVKTLRNYCELHKEYKTARQIAIELSGDALNRSQKAIQLKINNLKVMGKKNYNFKGKKWSIEENDFIKENLNNENLYVLFRQHFPNSERNNNAIYTQAWKIKNNYQPKSTYKKISTSSRDSKDIVFDILQDDVGRSVIDIHNILLSKGYKIKLSTLRTYLSDLVKSQRIETSTTLPRVYYKKGSVAREHLKFKKFSYMG